MTINDEKDFLEFSLKAIAKGQANRDALASATEDILAEASRFDSQFEMERHPLASDFLATMRTLRTLGREGIIDPRSDKVMRFVAEYAEGAKE